MFEYNICTVPDRNIFVYNSFYVGAVYIKSEIELEKYFI